ncbi:MAG: hypothetical protein AAB630_01075 [Patescibacteria group bacterium]
MNWTKWDILAGILLLTGAGLLFVAAGTSDVKSIVPDQKEFLSDGMLFALITAGCISAIAGVSVLTKKRREAWRTSCKKDLVRVIFSSLPRMRRGIRPLCRPKRNAAGSTRDASASLMRAESPQ